MRENESQTIDLLDQATIGFFEKQMVLVSGRVTIKLLLSTQSAQYQVIATREEARIPLSLNIPEPVLNR